MTENRLPYVQLQASETVDLVINSEADINGEALKFVAGNWPTTRDQFLPAGQLPPPGAKIKTKHARIVHVLTPQGPQPHRLWLTAKPNTQFVQAVTAHGRPMNTVLRMTRHGTGTSTVYTFMPFGILEQRPAPITPPQFGGGQARPAPAPTPTYGAPFAAYAPAGPAPTMAAAPAYAPVPPVYSGFQAAAPQIQPLAAPAPASPFNAQELRLIEGFREEQRKGNKLDIETVKRLLGSVLVPDRVGFLLQNAFNQDGTVKA